MKFIENFLTILYYSKTLHHSYKTPQLMISDYYPSYGSEKGDLPLESFRSVILMTTGLLFPCLVFGSTSSYENLYTFHLYHNI